MRANETMEEVWRWKDAASQATKDMSSAELVAYYESIQAQILEETGIKLDLPRGRPHEAATSGSRGIE